MEQEYIVQLKEVAPRIEHNIHLLESADAAGFYYQRLKQLALVAEQKVLSLKNGKKIVAQSVVTTLN